MDEMTNMLPMYMFSGIMGIIMLVALWKVFVKAGHAGWKTLIPIYNIVIIIRIAGMNPWLILAMIIPVVNAILALVIWYKFYTKFVSTGLAIVGVILPIVMLPYVAFAPNIEYTGEDGLYYS